MSTATITVLMPVYNGGSYLSEAVESILAQTFGDFELIVVNDGSTDRSEKILRHYADRDPRIKLISRPNTGIVGALNDGLAEAKGEFLARMDADDICLPHRFQTQIDFLKAHPDVLAVGSRVMLIDPYGSPICASDHKLEHADIDQQIMRGNGYALVHPTAMIRREAIERIGRYRKALQWVEDLDLWLRLAEIGKLANVPDVLLKYRKHPNSVNRTRRALQITLANTAMREAYERRGIEPPADWEYQAPQERSREEELRLWAWKAMKHGNVPAARRHAVALWRVAPLSKESWRTLFCTMRGY